MNGDHIAQRNDRGRIHAIGLVLFCSMVSKRHFVLVIQPRLIVLPLASVANPLPEALANPLQVAADRLPVRAGEVRQKVVVRADKAVPEVKDVLNLVAEDRSGLAQGFAVVVGEQQRLLEQAKVLDRERRTREIGAP